jgi:HEAT repeat protein
VAREPTRRSTALAGHRGDVDGARRGLDARDPAVRAVALGALERLGVLGSDELAAALADDDTTVRRRAATIAARHPDVDLLPALSDGDPFVVETAAWACGEWEHVNDAVLARLTALAGDAHADPLVRESAVAALGAIGDDRGLDAILSATIDKPAIRRRAVLALAPFLDPGHHRSTEVGEAIERSLHDRDWQVRQAAEDLLPRE